MDKTEMYKRIYENLQNFICPDPINSSNPPRGMLHFMIEGMTLDEETYDMEKVAGKQNVSNLVNSIPIPSANYQESVQKVQNVYQQILQSKLPPDEPRTQEQEAEYIKAKSFIKEKDNQDTYFDYYFKYDEAVDKYLKAQNLKSPEAASLKREVERLLDRWKVNDKDLYEKNMGIVRKYDATSPSIIYDEAAGKYQFGKENKFPIVCRPTKWYKEQDNLTWVDMVISDTSQQVHIHKDVEKTMESTHSVSIGWWRVSKNSTKFESQVSQLNELFKSEHLTIKMKIAKVSLDNSEWFDSSVLNYETTWIEGMPAGKISKGKLTDTQGTAMPVIPTALIICKDIDIYCDFSEKESSLIREVINASTDRLSVSFFGFSINKSSSSYSSEISDEEKKEFGSSCRITVKDKKQIIGVLSAVVPYYPYKSGLKSTNTGSDKIIEEIYAPSGGFGGKNFQLTPAIYLDEFEEI